MKDYSTYCFSEGASIEIAKKFISALKQMDEELAVKRLSRILNYNNGRDEFVGIAADFISMIGHKTCAD